MKIEFKRGCLAIAYLERKPAEDLRTAFEAGSRDLRATVERIAGRALTEHEWVKVRLAAWGYGVARDLVSGEAKVIK